MWPYNAAAAGGYPYPPGYYGSMPSVPSVPAAANAYAYPAAVGYPPAAASVPLSAYSVDASVQPVVSVGGNASVSADSHEYNQDSKGYEDDGPRYIEEEEPAIGAGKRLEMTCDARFNMNEVLAQNITSAEYFRQLYNLKTYHEVIDEALKKATHLEPYSAGQQRLPSTAFVLLYKFFTLKLTIKQLNGLLNHKNGIARGLGFLYLRYVCDPKKLWDWFEPFLDDESPIPASVDRSNPLPTGKFVRMLLTEHTYFGTMFKRIPIPVMREFQLKLAEHEIQKQKKAENEKIRPKLKVGTKCLALYAEDGQYYEAIVDELLPSGKILITYTQYSNQEEADIGNLKLIERGRASRSRSRSKERPRARSRSRSRGRARGRSRSASPRRDRDGRRDRDRRSRSRSRDRKERGRDSRDRDRGRRSRSRSRSRSRDRSRSGSKEGVSRDELLKQILRQEQDKAAASGKDYARRPASYKQALSLKLSVGTARNRSKSPPAASSSSRDRRRDRDRDREPSPPRRKEVSAEQKEKMQRLKAIYGDASDKAAGSSDYAPSAGSVGPKAKLVDTTDVIRLGQ